MSTSRKTDSTADATITTDVAVIGAGTAGLKAFSELRRRGLAVLLIDHGPLGTTCARVGCMPSKAVLHAGQQWATLGTLSRGAPARGAPVPGGVRSPDDLWRGARDTRDLLASNTVDLTQRVAGDRLVMGTARFTGPNTLDVDGRTIRARAFIVATGSHPVVPPSLAPLGDRLLTTDTLFDLETLPARVGILGLGAVGLEIGLALARLGVEVIGGDMKTLPAGITDPEIGARAIERFSSELTMWLGRPLEAEGRKHGIELRSGDSRAEVDVVIAALGRRPNLDKLNLAAAGVALGARGEPLLDAQTLRAGSSTIFLAGDVSNLRPLMHEASDEGSIAAQAAAHALGVHDARGASASRDGKDNRDGAADTPINRRTPLAIVFSDPDIATVGRTWPALDPGQTVVGDAQGNANGRSRVIGEEGNLVRIYVERASARVVGASLIASHGEHLAHLLAWAIQRGETVDGLLEMPYYHPSIEEMVQSALKVAARKLAT